MYISKKYELDSWYSFDDDIFKAAQDFYSAYGFFANLVVFNHHTYEQICYLISNSPKRQYIKDDNGEENIDLARFKFSDCTLKCGFLTELADKEFKLIYDSDPDWDNDLQTINDPIVKKELDKIKC